MNLYKASYRWTKEEFVRAYKSHHQANLRPGFVTAISILLLFMSVLSFYILLVGGLHSSAALSSIILMAFTFYWFVLCRVITQWWLGRNFDKRPDANLLIEQEICEDKIRTRCGDLAFGESQWAIFIKIVETNEGFLQYSHKQIFYWLLFSAFGEVEGIEKYREFAKANQIPFTKNTGK